ncbi:MAG: response regulator transcription factor [Planctomycetota bacterium]
MTSRVLIVEDEAPIRDGLVDRFGREGFDAVGVGDGESAAEALAGGGFDLVLLDLMLPGMSGEEVLVAMRERGDHTPVVVVSARGREPDRVLLLTLGADDYVVKPFSVRELVARARAILRRTAPPDSERIEFGDVVVDPAAFTLSKAGTTHPITATEKGMLQLLWSRRGQAVPRDDFLREVWGYGRIPETRTVDFHVVRLRRKIEDDPDRPRHLVTVRGVGYRLDPEG